MIGGREIAFELLQGPNPRYDATDFIIGKKVAKCFVRKFIAVCDKPLNS